MEKDYYFDEYGVRRRRKGIKELRDLVVDEISLVDIPAIKKEFMIVKGDDKKMDEEKELKGWEDISAKEIIVLNEAVSILGRYDLINDLERARTTLQKYFGEEVKKYSDNKCEWSQAQRAIFGFCEDDLSFINENIEIGKSDPNDKFPSLTRQFNLNQRRLEKAYEEYGLESRAI